MSDFKIGDLVIINYGEVKPADPVHGIVVKIDYSVESNIKTYRVSQANYDWTLPYTEHELRRYNHDKSNGQSKVSNSLGNNQKEDGEKGSEADRKDR